MRRWIAFVGLVLAGCSSPAPKTPAKNAQAAVPQVSVTQFYPTATRIGKGERVELCYGVDNASTVTLQPPVEKVWPALVRCFEVRPAVTTRYTLTATDSEGRSASKSATIEVGPAKPAGPHIVEVTINKIDIARGEPVVVCYNVKNAISVKITPGEAIRASAERGCVTDKPAATTTYQVVATGEGGQTDSERVTVKVH
jgi:hypothetical protein